MGPYGCTRGRCQPPSSDQQMSTMWSVKCLPKPGSAMMSACSAADFAASLRVTANWRVCGARRFFMIRVLRW